MKKPKRLGEPTKMWGLLEKAPDFKSKLEVLKRFSGTLCGGQLGLAAAMLVKCSDEEGLYNGYQGIADIIGMDYLHIMSAMHILRAGTPDEIQLVKDGYKGVNKLSRDIVKRSPLPSSQRRYKGSQHKGKNIQRNKDMVDRADMWRLLRAALDGLTSLPMPSEVSHEVRKNNQTRDYTNDRLDRALNWLKDFADAYRSQQGQQEGGQVADQAEAGDDHSNPGTGSAVA